MIFINNEMIFFSNEMTFSNIYIYQLVALYSLKIIVNLKIFEVGVPVHLNLRVYRRSFLNIYLKSSKQTGG